ncbi:MAG: glycoside hydrolase family 127 protein, partial [Candidatus Caldatribacteriaceae bacterium]
QFRLKLRKPVRFTIAIRLPGWCSYPEFWVNDRRETPTIIKGYAHFTRIWSDGDTIFYRLPMPVERIRAHPQVRYVQGKVALMRGPLVYCVEEVDNGSNLSQLVLPQNFSFDARFEPQTLGGVVILQRKAFREKGFPSGEVLYSREKPSKEESFLRAVPYTPGETEVRERCLYGCAKNDKERR